MSAEPFRVGLTGTVAAGKSAVGRLFETWGATRIDADELAREAVRPGSDALAQIREAWGDGVLAADGSLDRAAMRRRVFGDERARARLEAFIHAAVRELRAERRSRAAAAGARIVVEEIPLLFEVGLDEEYDTIVTVDAAPALREARARAARGWTAEEFAAIDASQLPAAEKRRRADHVIDNDRDRKTLERTAYRVWEAITALAEAGRAAARVDGPRDRA